MSRGQMLQAHFDSPEAFQQEYAANLANGGVFIASDQPFELRERVHVEIVLGFCGRRVVLAGEIVHLVTQEMAELGASAGAAVQFDGSVHTVRTLLEPLRREARAPRYRPKDPGRRRSPRTPARVPARIEGSEFSVDGHTSNLSQTGVLVSVPGRGAPVGERVQVSLTHPGMGESMRIGGVVAREVESDGGVSALAIEFSPAEGEREEMHRFLEAVQGSEHTRRLGGVKGDIEELGVENLLQMFANTGSGGTLELRDGNREGVVGFESGLLRFVRLGPTSGMKALVRLLTWTAGRFEFHAQLDPVEQLDAPLPLAAALLEATRILDEERHRDASRLAPELMPRISEAGEADEEALSKTEAAVLDLVRVGFSVGRILSVIPEPDPEVHRALESLCDRGVITV